MNSYGRRIAIAVCIASIIVQASFADTIRSGGEAYYGNALELENEKIKCINVNC